MNTFFNSGSSGQSVHRYKPTKALLQFVLISSLFITGSCVTEFLPDIKEEKELLVVEGLISDQLLTYKINLSKSLPFGERSDAIPFTGCIVTISDNFGNLYSLTENKPGTYITDSTKFRGIIGRLYTLHISTNNPDNKISYESYPMEMKPVPPIDSLYYEKIVLKEDLDNFFGIDACQIYLDTHDPQNKCRYYRWDYSETWVLRLLFPVENMTCWVSDSSENINIKNTVAFEDVSIYRHPIIYISNFTDRLKKKYSLEVNQYSLNEIEYSYWEKMQKLTDQTGSLYDVIPSSIPGNIICLEKPDEKVLGFFSVSAVSSKRIFIQDKFKGIVDQYSHCPTDTIYGDYDPPELGISRWVISDIPYPAPRTRILTDDLNCADCTTRGTKTRPDFWIGE